MAIAGDTFSVVAAIFSTFSIVTLNHPASKGERLWIYAPMDPGLESISCAGDKFAKAIKATIVTPFNILNRIRLAQLHSQ